jgi:hypothetical protein
MPTCIFAAHAGPSGAKLLRGRPRDVSSQAPELGERKIGITPFDYPCDRWREVGRLLGGVFGRPDHRHHPQVKCPEEPTGLNMGTGQAAAGSRVTLWPMLSGRGSIPPGPATPVSRPRSPASPAATAGDGRGQRPTGRPAHRREHNRMPHPGQPREVHRQRHAHIITCGREPAGYRDGRIGVRRHPR